MLIEHLGKEIESSLSCTHQLAIPNSLPFFYAKRVKKRSRKQTKRHFKQIFQLFGLAILLVTIVAGVLQIQVVREFLSRATGQPANLVIDLKADQGPLSKPWQYLAQGGEDHAWDMQPIVPTVKALEPQYIRIDHVYDFYDVVSRDGNGQLQFDFSKLDRLLDSIDATGAKPFIALSYMPPAIASSDILSEPNNWSEWQLTVQRTIEHISGTRGTTDVYYEVWNEPDLFGGWHYGKQKNYLTLYSYAARGAANARNVRPFQFGGPGITALYKNWFTALTKFAIENDLRYDFFSWHRYDLKVDQFEQDVRDIRTWQLDFPQTSNLELLITEWGHDSENSPGYDGTFSAAHTVAAAIEMVGTVEKAFEFEIEDGKDPEGAERWGRWGLLTHQDFGAKPKPRYQALRMLNELGDNRISSIGNGSWVKSLATRNDNGEFKIVIANYDSTSRNSEIVPVTFRNADPGEYRLEQRFLNGREQQSTLTSTNGFMNTTVTMPANTVAVLTLTATNTTPASPLPAATPDVPLTGFGRLLGR